MKVLAVLVLVFAAGCGAASKASPTQEWAAAQDVVTVTRQTILDMHEWKAVTDEQLIAIDPIVRTAQSSLDVAAASLPDGGPAFEQAMTTLWIALAELATQDRARIEAAGARSRSLTWTR